MKKDERLKMFGFVEGKTKCERCGELLTKDTAWWGQGTWWHRLVKDCKLIENQLYEKEDNMKKIKSLFQRDYIGNRQVYDEIVDGSEWVQQGIGVATEKWEGTACMIQNGKLYKRYDVKKKRTPPENGIPCEPKPNEKTGHWPWWKPVGDEPDSKYHREAFAGEFADGTYELIGEKVQGNPYGMKGHKLIRHGIHKLHPPRFFNDLKIWFETNIVEGIVWHNPNGEMVKIKRKDFGFAWPVKE